MMVFFEHGWKWLHVIESFLDEEEYEYNSNPVTVTPKDKNKVAKIRLPKVNKEFFGMSVLLGAVMYSQGWWKWQIPVLVLYLTGIFDIFYRAYSFLVRNHSFSHIFSTILFLISLLLANSVYYYYPPKNQIQEILIHGIISFYNALRIKHLLQSKVNALQNFNIYQLIFEAILMEIVPLNLFVKNNLFVEIILLVVLLISMLIRFTSNQNAIDLFYSDNLVDDEKMNLTNQIKFEQSNSMLAALQILIHVPKLQFYRVHASIFYFEVVFLTYQQLQYNTILKYLLETQLICVLLLIPIMIMKATKYFSSRAYKSNLFTNFLSIVYGIYGAYFTVGILESIKSSSVVLLALESFIDFYFNVALDQILLLFMRTLIVVSLGFPIGLCMMSFVFGWGKGWSNFIGPVIFLLCSLFIIDGVFAFIFFITIGMVSKFLYTIPSFIVNHIHLVYYGFVSPLLYISMSNEWLIEFPHFKIQ